MDSERRYSEDEISEILDRATEAQTSRTPTSSGATGLTLRELQEIGREVGIPDEVITNAAASLDRPRPETAAPQKFLGQTIGVGRVVDLPRPLTDAEWHRLVVDLRETFDAKGKISEDGPFRGWSNSNLQALLEPTATGERLRLRTLKGNARVFQGMGGAFLAAGTVMSLAGLLGMAGDPSNLTLIALGAGFFLSSRLTVPSWARTRGRQFEEIIGRVMRTLEAPAAPTSRLPGRTDDDEDQDDED